MLISLLLFQVEAFGQSLPVGTPLLEDYYRRAQLLGKIDSTVSFTVRPSCPVEAFHISNPFFPDLSVPPSLRPSVLPSLRPSVSHSFFSPSFILLPFTLQQQYNTHHPYSLNDGEMIPARGYQTMVSGGFFAKLGPLTLQLRPEYVYAQNSAFDGFGSGKGQPDKVWAGYYNFINRIDLPERFGDKPYNRLFWGQSSIRLNFGAVSAGISNENMWWGPGMRNSLLMTNTSGGFMHFTFNTVRPIRTHIGSFEGQIIAGRLDGSGFFPPDTARKFNGYTLYIPKKNDWRYINGIVLTYQPKWTPGLFIGITRSYMVYSKEMGNFPVISPVNKKNSNGGSEVAKDGNQLRSLFARWLMPKGHAEVYFEYGRDDFSYNLRDFILEPDYARAYIIGFRKLFQLNPIRDEYVQFNIEVTQIEQNRTNTRRELVYFYAHSDTRHGYTNRGQLLGAGIGPGSDMQNISITWNRSLKMIGFQFERYVHNNDFHYNDIKDIRANWVDIAAALLGEYDYKNFLLSAKAELIRSFNYEHLYDPLPGSIESFWSPGRDVYNFQVNVGITYRF